MFETIPAKREDRWRLMGSLIRTWMRPLTEADAITPEELDQAETRLGIRLPKALREWYTLAGNAKDIWCWQDHLCSAKALHIRDEVLVFCFENQGIWRMGPRLSDLDREDPPAFAWMNEAWEGPSEFGQLNASLSECALQYLAWVMPRAPWNPRFACRIASGFSDHPDFGWWAPATLAAIEQNYIRCAFPVWRLWERDNVFYERGDILIHVGHRDAGGDDPILHVAVRTREALAAFEAIVRETGFRWGSGRWST